MQTKSVDVRIRETRKLKPPGSIMTDTNLTPIQQQIKSLFSDAMEYSANLRITDIVNYNMASNFINTVQDIIYYVSNDEPMGKNTYNKIIEMFCDKHEFEKINFGNYCIIYDNVNIHGAFSYHEYTEKTYGLYYIINQSYVESLNDVADNRPDKNDTPIISRISVDNRGCLEMNNILFNAPKIDIPSNIMYPWFEYTPEEYALKFIESNANILLLYGDPGTGKTTFIKKMLQGIGFTEARKINVVDTPDVMNSPELVNRIYISKHKDIFIFEDVDKHLYSRSDGNEIMAGLLNAAEGLASPDVKIIISTNIKRLSDIDSALIRPGRCYKTLEFHTLDQEQQIGIRNFLDLDTEVCSGKQSLAEVMNEKSAKIQAFGFN
ncbi:Phage protein [Yersinia phage fHe-Yen9-04]|uniref:Phage protein n=2 Tax=Eneladusvirus Yen904 TaxID=2560849 RepID=A0A2C9CZI3_9CAUD|nr:Phage protein [Yersinia phage fHe-Yen9-04]SOK58788.1 Phage protein [Yersinia phage fHe-Yen9-04]SOK59326.1 Phage protein [Yersinia phage fHe-Yen9-03]VUE36557.1 Phage protein [Yersinia phage fHe-Yen9-04]